MTIKPVSGTGFLLKGKIKAMDKDEFAIIRKKLGKTQKEMATLLGISNKTVESYEQGLRNIPVNVERILYLLFFKLNREKLDEKQLCWDKKGCALSTRSNCLAWLAKEGFYCWFITGKVCAYENQSSQHPGTCFNCSFFKENLGKIRE
jgi:transcriptional regulator with XRE-family HTH domain